MGFYKGTSQSKFQTSGLYGAAVASPVLLAPSQNRAILLIAVIRRL